MSGDGDNNAPVTNAEFSELLTTTNVVKEQMKEIKQDLADEQDASDHGTPCEKDAVGQGSTIQTEGE